MTSEYIFSGSLPENASTYVTRQADTDLYDALNVGAFCYVLNSRQTGKSSLRVRTMRRLREEGIACAAIDLSFGGTQYVTMEQWYVDMLDTLVESFGLDVDLEDWWEERESLSPLRRFRRFIEEILLVEIEGRIVIFIDEIDSILSLNFPTDDFFAFIRACYQERVNNPEFHRLTFCLLGVATPTNLIQDKKRTPFNIGRAIALKGFQPHEVQPLVQGLQGKVEHPERILDAVLEWTGGQPFLTQKVCHLLASGDPPQPPLIRGESSLASPFSRGTGGGSKTEQEWVAELVQQHVIENWEAQDEPEHLRTIRDRILSDEQRAGRLLGLYQEILQAPHSPLAKGGQGGSNSEGIPADDSQEQIELRLTGLVIKRNGRLKPYNPIYAQVFNWNWVEEELATLRPYAEAIDAWIASGYQDESRLLRGEALQEALAWATGRNLSEKDFQFLSASQALDMWETQKALELEQKARKLEQLEAQEKQRRTQEELNKLIARQLKISVTGLLLIVLTIGALVFGAWSGIQRRRAAINEVVGLKTSAWALLASNQEFDAAIEALRASKKLKQIAKVKADVSIPLAVVLQQAIYKIRERNRLESHTNQVFSIQFSPNGQMLASASADNTIKLWNRDGTLLHTLEGHKEWVSDVSFSPDGKKIVSASEDNTIKLWDLEGRLLNTFIGHSDNVNGVTFSPNGKTLASASSDNTVKLWNLEGKLLKTFIGHQDEVYSVDFHPNRQIIASGSKDKTIKTWNLNGTEIKTLEDHQDRVFSVSFSPQGKMIASGSADSMVKLWNLDGNLLQTFQGHQGVVWKVNFSPDGKKIASASKDTTAKIWSVKGISPSTFKGHKGVVWAVSFSPNDRIIASASEDHMVKLWDRHGALLNVLKGHKDIVFDLSFNSEGKIVASASKDKTIKLWKLDGTLLKTLTDHVDRVYSVTFSPDGKTIASASRDKTIKFWHPSGRIIKTLKGHTSPVNWVSFSPNGKILASASDDRTVKLWSREGKLLKTLIGHTNEVLYVGFSSDGKLIASASRDNSIKLWYPNGDLQRTLKGHKAPVMSVTFSSDNKLIASASLDETIKFWNPSGRELVTIKEHKGQANLVTFSKDNQLLISASSDKTAILWDLNLDNLQRQGCTWLKEYFQTNPNLPEDINLLCNNINQ